MPLWSRFNGRCALSHLNVSPSTSLRGRLIGRVNGLEVELTGRWDAAVD